MGAPRDKQYCSGVILDVLGLYTIFDPVKFYVRQGSPEKVTQDTGNNIYHSTFLAGILGGKSMSVDISLQGIRGLNYTMLSEQRLLSHELFYNGGSLFTTSGKGYLDKHSRYGYLGSVYELTNQDTARVLLRFSEPQLSAAGLYEYQFYLHVDTIKKHLNWSSCAAEYTKFMYDMRLRHFLIGTATLNLTVGERVVVSATKNNYTTNEGSTLSCSLAEQLNQTVSEMSWFKNGYQVKMSNSKIMYLDTMEVKQLDLNVYGTYTCNVLETNGHTSTKTIHIMEKAPFSIHLQVENGLLCEQGSAESIKAALLQELILIFSQACDCMITKDYFTTVNMSCDSNVLTLSTDLVYSDRDGNMTASDMLQSAAARLTGVRTIHGETMVIDTSCAIKDAEQNCIQAVMPPSNDPDEDDSDQLTLLAIVLLALLGSLLAGISIAIVVRCALFLRKRKRKLTKPRQPAEVQRAEPQREQQQITVLPINVAPTNEPQPYSYPMVHSLVGRRAVSMNGSSCNTVISTRRNTVAESTVTSSNGQASQRQAQNTGRPQGNRGPSNGRRVLPRCVPNPAYTSPAVEENPRSNNTRNVEQNMNNETNQDHVYDYPQFVESQGERESSWEEYI